MRKLISFHLKSKKVRNRIIITIILVVLFILVNGVIVYNFAVENNSYFSFIKRIIPFPAIMVRGSIITMADFDREVFLAERLYEETYKIDFSKNDNKGTLQEIKKNIKESLINRAITRYIARELGVGVSGRETDQEYKRMAGEIGVGKDVGDVLKFASGWSEKDLKEKIYYSLLEKKVKDNLVYQVKLNIIAIIPQDINISESWDEAYKKATEAQQKIIDGQASFEEVKKQYEVKAGLTQEKKNPDFYYLYELPQSLSQSIPSISVGNTSGIIKDSSGYYIIKLEEERGSYKGSFNDFLGEQREQTKIWVFAPGIRS